MIKKFSALKNEKEFIKLICANFISDIGNNIDNIALTWLIYQVSDSLVWVAIIYGASFLPHIFFQPLLGVLVENYKKRNVAIFADIIGFIAIMVVLFLYITNNLNSWILLVFSLINASLEAIRIPAGIAFKQKILSKENYVIGYSLSSSLTSLAALLGLSLTGFIIGLLGVQFAMFMDALSFLISALILIGIKYKEKITNKLSINSFKTDLKDGVVYVKSNTNLLVIIAFCIFLNIQGLAINTYLAAFIADYLVLDVWFYSLVSVVFAGFGIIGGMVAPTIVEKLNVKLILLLHGLIVALNYVVFILIVGKDIAYILVFAIVFIALYGIVSSLTGVLVGVLFALNVKDEFRARAGALFNASTTASFPIVSALMSAVAIFLNLDQIFMLFAIITFAGTIVFVLSKKVSKLKVKE